MKPVRGICTKCRNGYEYCKCIGATFPEEIYTLPGPIPTCTKCGEVVDTQSALGHESGCCNASLVFHN